MEWLEKLKQAKEVLDDLGTKGADHLRKFAQFLKEASECLDNAANTLHPTGSQPLTLSATHTQDVEDFLTECRKEAMMQAPMTEVSGWKEIGISLLIDLARKLLEKHRNNK